MRNNCFLFEQMASAIITILVLWVTAIRSFEANEECDERYSNITQQHTMCKGVNESCHFLRHKGKVYDKQLLRTHNLIRNSIRKYVGKNYPLATNMELMNWDDELYDMARIHSLQCVEQPDCDLCHQNGDFPVEQNFAVKTYKKSEVDSNGPVKRFQTVIKEWAAELKLYDPSVVGNLTTTGGLPTHWTNILRANTSLVGCASMNFYTDEPDVFKEVYVCNYGPAELSEGDEIYKTGGKSCSNCEDDGICHSEFKNLCVPAEFELNITIIVPEEEEVIEFWPGGRNYTETIEGEESDGIPSTTTETLETLLMNETRSTEEVQISTGEEHSSVVFTETSPERTSISEFTEMVPSEHTEVAGNAHLRKRKIRPSISRMLR